MRIAVVGAGAVGARAARQLLTLGGVERLAVADVDSTQAEAVARSLGGPAQGCATEAALADSDVVVLAHPAPEANARTALEAGAHVVATSGLLVTARALAALDAEARERRRSVVVGAAMSPGLSCLLARAAARRLESVSSIDVASTGSGGRACAAERRAALGKPGARWDGAWHEERGGSGRRLAAFPEPVGYKDCFAAASAEAFLVADAFPGARVSSALAATMLERATALVPGLEPRRSADSALGAVRVEVHGRADDGTAAAHVLGAVDRPALAAGAVSALAARWAASNRFARHGAGGLAALVDDPVAYLRELADLGIRAAEYASTA